MTIQLTPVRQKGAVVLLALLFSQSATVFPVLRHS